MRNVDDGKNGHLQHVNEDTLTRQRKYPIADANFNGKNPLASG
jgi:hypothetical protein